VPEVIYIGYMRAGSTFLRSYFTAHPQIQWTRFAWYFQLGRSDQERRDTYLRFFEPIKRCGRLIDVYEGLCLGQYFPKPANNDYLQKTHPEWAAQWAMRVEGELTTAPVAVNSAEIARRIGHCLPEAKVLIVLRNQVDWLRSMYVHYLAHLPRRRQSFADFLNTPEGKSAACAGLFDQTLRAYFDVFGRDRVHVMLLEQLARYEQVSLRRLCSFLGVRFHPFDSKCLDYNKGRGDALQRVRGRLFAALAALGFKESSVLKESEKSYLRAFYSASNARTAKLLAVDLARYGYPC